MSDAQNALRLDLLEPLLERLTRIHAIDRAAGMTDQTVRLKPDTTSEERVRLKPDATRDNAAGVVSGFSRINHDQ